MTPTQVQPYLQDTALPLSPHHYSSIPRLTMPDSSLSSLINANSLIITYIHHLCDTGTAPSQRQALEHDTDPLSLIHRHRLPCFGYIGRLLYLHSSTLGSAVSHVYYRQIRPIGVNPDPRPRLFLAALVCIALSY